MPLYEVLAPISPNEGPLIMPAGRDEPMVIVGDWLFSSDESRSRLIAEGIIRLLEVPTKPAASASPPPPDEGDAADAVSEAPETRARKRRN